MFRQNRLRIFDGRKTALMPVFSSLPALTATGISSSLCLFFRDLPRITHIGAIRFRVVFASAFRYPYHRPGVLIVRNHCRGWRCRRFRFRRRGRSSLRFRHRRRGRLRFWSGRRCIGLPCHRCRCCCRYRRRGKGRFRGRRRCGLRRRGRIYRRSRSRRRGQRFGDFFSQFCFFSQSRFRNAFFRFTHAFLLFCYILFPIVFLRVFFLEIANESQNQNYDYPQYCFARFFHIFLPITVPSFNF